MQTQNSGKTVCISATLATSKGADEICLAFREDNIPVPSLARWSAMNLQRNHPRQRDLRIWLGVVHRQRTVDVKSDAPAFAMDLVAIPITGLQDLLDDRRIGPRQHFVPA